MTLKEAAACMNNTADAKTKSYVCSLDGKTHRDTAAGRGATSTYAMHYEWRIGGPRDESAK